MKFFLIEITTYNDGKNDAKGVYDYATLDEAVANFHSKMGEAMKNETYASELLMIINSEGGVHKIEKYIKPTVPIEETVDE